MYKPLRKESLEKQVYNQLKNLIIEGHLLPGDFLPSERELCEQFQVSRLPVREALKKLEAIGVISISHGGKTLIRGMGVLPIIEILDFVQENGPSSVEDLTEARLIFEVGAARLSALRAEEEDIKRMREICQRMESDIGNQDELIAESLAFHLALAKSSKNKTVTNFMIMIVDLQRQSREITLSYLEGQQLSLEDHWNILNCIENRDPEGAANEMRKHLILRGPCKEKLKSLLEG